jgi:hypothetical protein
VHGGVRPRDADEHRRESDEQHGEREVSSPTRRGGDEVRQQRGIAEAPSGVDAAPLPGDVQRREQRHDEQGKQRER